MAGFIIQKGFIVISKNQTINVTRNCLILLTLNCTTQIKH